MDRIKFFFLIIVIVPVLTDDLNNHAFPDDFMFGAGTASYQIEGGWDANGKTENIWDRFTHEHPERILNQDNGDVACDSFHKYKEDVQLLKELGVSHYRFSLSWTRIFPTGYANEINVAGVIYYQDLIQELKDNNIEPLVTLYHWDLPQTLQDAGGWLNETIVELFGDYARGCFSLFGDSVRYWLTLNEVYSFCYGGYAIAILAPGFNNSGTAEYLCAHNALKAHARAWHIYDEEFRATQKGKVGMSVPSHWFQPATEDPKDVQAAQTKLEFMFGWMGHPVLLGDYPESMKTIIGRRSQQEGLNKSRLPEFSSEEIEYIKGTIDLLGINIYTAFLARPASDPNIDIMDYEIDSEVEVFQPDDWPASSYSWLKVTPWAIGNMTNWIKNTYNNPQMIITENGYSDNGTTLEDNIRINYLQSYLSSLRDSMDQGANIIGYTSWSLLDSFEWLAGYTQKFGLYYVDFDSPNRTRIAKKSVDYYKNVIKTKCIVDTCV